MAGAVSGVGGGGTLRRQRVLVQRGRIVVAGTTLGATGVVGTVCFATIGSSAPLG